LSPPLKKKTLKNKIKKKLWLPHQQLGKKKKKLAGVVKTCNSRAKIEAGGCPPALVDVDSQKW